MSIEFFTPQILEAAKILNIHPIFLTDDPPSQVLDFLYIGSMFNAAYLQGLKDLKITHIVNVTKEIDNFYPDQFVYHRIKILDKDGQDLLPHLENVVEFIRSAEQQGGVVIVHCKVGMCRSASVIAAYLKRYKKMDVNEAELFLQDKRNIVRIRDSFKIQLNKFEQFINFFKLYIFQQLNLLQLFIRIKIRNTILYKLDHQVIMQSSYVQIYLEALDDQSKIFLMLRNIPLRYTLQQLKKNSYIV